MDEVLESIASFAADLRYEGIPSAVIAVAKERLIDSVGCALGALGLPRGCATADVGYRVASRPSRPDAAGRVIGTSDEDLSAESAAFINGCLIRDLDFSDSFPGHHPSDALGGILSVAPVLKASGRDVLAAMVVSYEISVRLLKIGQFNRKGWDNGYSTGIGAAAAIARLMGLSRDELRHAVAITATANVPMRATRAGQLSMWKGAATAFSVRDATFAARLAADGMTGPEAPFTGRHGVMDLITGPMELPPFPNVGGEFLMPLVKMKYWPVVYNMQALVWCGINLREWMDGRDIIAIDIRTYWSAWRESGSEPAKWDPRTRETADHSAPYILAYVLEHGGIDHDAFEPNAYLDDAYRRTMAKITVSADEEIESTYPAEIKMRVVATDSDGSTKQFEIVNPIGHDENPMSAIDIEAKFGRLARSVMDDGQVARALERWWRIDECDAAEALDLLVDEKRQALIAEARGKRP